MEDRQVPSPNAYDFYLTACEAMVDRELPESCSGGCACKMEQRELTLDEKSAIVERNSAALQKLREGFAYEYRVPGEAKSLAKKRPYYPWLAKLCQMESEVLLARDDSAGAMSSLLDAIHLGSDLPRGGLLADAALGHVTESFGLSRSRQIIDRLDGDSARVLARRAGEIYRRHVPFTETLENEKQRHIADLSAKSRRIFWRFRLARRCSDMLGCVEFLRALAQVYPLSRRALLEDYERYMDAQIALAQMPHSVAEQQPEVVGNYVSLSRGLQAVSYSRVATDTGAVRKAFLAVALALRAYWLDHGAYPGDLGDLVPDYLGAVPQDPFTGDAPLRYRIDGDRYILYSIGPDGVDDGGTAICDPNLTFAPKAQYRVHPKSKGDIVVGVNW